MDPISQGVVGGIFSQSLSRKTEERLASITGFLAGMTADLDVLIKSEADPLLTIQYHRHFTHCLLFIPIGGLICATIALLFYRTWNRILPSRAFQNIPTFKRLYFYSFLLSFSSLNDDSLIESGVNLGEF